MLGRNELRWDKDILYKGHTNLGYKLVPHETYAKMYWIILPNGEKSVIWYNKTIAKENSVLHAIRGANNTPEDIS